MWSRNWKQGSDFPNQNCFCQLSWCLNFHVIRKKLHFRNNFDLWVSYILGVALSCCWIVESNQKLKFNIKISFLKVGLIPTTFHRHLPIIWLAPFENNAHLLYRILKALSFLQNLADSNTFKCALKANLKSF